MFQPSRKLDLALLETVLPHVKQPAQYIGGEHNQVVKDCTTHRIRWALSFPDAYNIGMSHQGLKILYDVLNQREDALAKRVFAPWPDMEQRMRENAIPMFSWDSHQAVRSFDVLGFSLLYELYYTNLLTILDLASIPLDHTKRNDADPVILAGGHCTNSPEAISDFVDLFCIGEAE